MLPTTIQPFTLLSDQDGLPLSGLLLLPQEETVPCGILQVSHGMCEHKERYLDFLRHCTKQGYICLIHDHRGLASPTGKVMSNGYPFLLSIIGFSCSKISKNSENVQG